MIQPEGFERTYGEMFPEVTESLVVKYTRYYTWA